jgi:hypothetical protein
MLGPVIITRNESNPYILLNQRRVTTEFDIKQTEHFLI